MNQDKFVIVNVHKDLLNLLRDYEDMWDNEKELRGFWRKTLEQYEYPEYWDEDEPSGTAMYELTRILTENPEASLFFIY